MKTISKKDYFGDGMFINLDNYGSAYENLLLNHQKYFKKNKKYYIYCQKGFKSKRVASILEAYGYDVIRLIN